MIIRFVLDNLQFITTVNKTSPQMKNFIKDKRAGRHEHSDVITEHSKFINSAYVKL
ncbi:hypothetical protein HanIR_Chr16g0843731 [Helianthus annuus]|nr:hypothetical protein HanIR_Chr16g0843731 [Helianthus annuus]